MFDGKLDSIDRLKIVFIILSFLYTIPFIILLNEDIFHHKHLTITKLILSSLSNNILLQ